MSRIKVARGGGTVKQTIQILPMLIYASIYTSILNQSVTLPITNLVWFLFAVKVFGAKNIKKYGGDLVTILNPCHVSAIYT